MHIIKLNAIDSTNSYLRELSSKKSIDDYTVVVAKTQTKGRGQLGTVWESEKGMNLTCSVYKDCSMFSVKDHFYISIITSLAIIKTLHDFNIPKLVVKWPNDILSEQKKICGILIENVIKHDTMDASIIGIGLNVNQTVFKNLPQASSLKNLTGMLYDKDEIMSKIVSNMKWYFRFLELNKLSFLKTEYESYLFRKDKPSTFMDKNRSVFLGFIKGISDSGNLKVELEDKIEKEFELKEISLLY